MSLRCLEGVWNVSGKCLECFWKLSRRELEFDAVALWACLYDIFTIFVEYLHKIWLNLSSVFKNLYLYLTLLNPGGGAERHPLRVLLIAHKRMLRSLRNFLTFPKYQK